MSWWPIKTLCVSYLPIYLAPANMLRIYAVGAGGVACIFMLFASVNNNMQYVTEIAQC